MVPPLHERDAKGRQVFQQNIPHPVQLPPGPRLIPGQAGAELLLDKVISLIETGPYLGVGGKARPGTGIPQGTEQILPQAGQKHPLAPQLSEGDALLLPEWMPPGHQQAGRVGPEGGAGQHRGRAAKVHDKAGIQLALFHSVGHGIVGQQPEPHFNVGVLLAELVQLGLKAGQIVRHEGDADADADRLGGLDLRMEGRLHLLELLHHRRCVALKAHAPVGEGELVVGAEEQRPAQFCFQGGDALPQCLPGQEQALGSTGVVHLFAQDQKIVQLADIHGFPPENVGGQQ